jgi:hypothetical protein
MRAAEGEAGAEASDATEADPLMDVKQTAILNGLQRDGLIDSWTVEPDRPRDGWAVVAMTDEEWAAEVHAELGVWLTADDWPRAEDDSVHPRDVPGR